MAAQDPQDRQPHEVEPQPQQRTEAEVPLPFFPLAPLLRQALGNDLPCIRVVDAGAMILSQAEDVWKPLVRRGLCDSVVGFEPNADECKKLNAHACQELARSGPAGAPSTQYRFLATALGDGSTGEFRLCSAPMTSSMLEPNIPLLQRFTQLEEVTTVVQRTEMQTQRLDDLKSDLPGGIVDFLKLDVQGYELAVLQGAKGLLRKTLVVHTEVEFVEMYHGQPLFAEVDQFLRGQGFVFHRFASIHGRPVKPIHLKENPLQPISQQLWADAVYVRDLWDLADYSKEELLKAALILHEIYHSYDIVHHVLKKHGDELAQKYLNAVLASR